MAFEHTMRWFGDNDPYSLKDLKMTGISGIVSALHHIETGEVWSVEEILNRKYEIEKEGLSWSVVESLPVHEYIKMRNNNYSQLIENYKSSIKNLSKCGINNICYNFMPVLDWSRTDLRMVNPDESISTKFELTHFATFDIHILKRNGATKDYSDIVISEANKIYEKMSELDKTNLTETILYALPGSLKSYSISEFKEILRQYNEVSEEILRENLFQFLQEIIPIAEEEDVYMSIHPDDPPWPLLGLPRIVKNYDDLNSILSAHDSPHNGITLCTGSLGACINNDVINIVKSFCNRVNFLHLRNVKRTINKTFEETDHLNGEIDLWEIMRLMLKEQSKRAELKLGNSKIPMRPDHGNLFSKEFTVKDIYPGYSLLGRTKALGELRGLEYSLLREYKYNIN